MKLSPVDWFIWICGITTTLFLASWIYRSGQARRFPVFSSLIAYRGIKSIVLAALLLRAGYASYYFVYWANAVIQYLWLGLVLIEVARQVSAPYGAMPRKVATMVASAAVVAAILAAGVAASTQSAIPYKIEAAVMSASRSADFGWLAAFMALASISSWLGLGWRRTENGIAAGLCIEMMAAALSDLIYQHSGFTFLRGTDQLHQLIALIAFVPWFAAFRRIEQREQIIGLPAVKSALLTLEGQHSLLRKR